MNNQQTYTLLFDIALILTAAYTLGQLARRLGQPAVIGEILLGILLGPTAVPASVGRHLIPMDVRPLLSALAGLGVALFMFLVGLETDHRALRGDSRKAAGAAAGAMALPLGLGCLLATVLYKTGHAQIGRTGFILFFGVAMSMTAFPVLARILAEDKMRDTAVAGVALTAAAIGDVAVWTVLALVLAGTDHQSGWRLLVAVPYVAVLLLGVRPALARLAGRHRGQETPTGILVAVFVLVLVSGAVTQWCGLDFIFGAFLAGVVFPRTVAEPLRERIAERTGVVGNTLLMPIYFVMAGLNVNLRTVGWSGMADLGLILVVAIGGKILGGYLGARFARLPARQSATVGILMNTRGLTELIILGIGLQLHYLDGRLYSLMVAMAVVTTAMTGPLLQVAYPVRSRVRRTVPPAPRVKSASNL
ncbi:MAG: cation/H(+) antiporter [Catenulispora sp.]|nr:cation/H(+) antiporter [Catenulispora sp.]